MKRIIRYFRDFYAHCGGAVIGYLLLTIVHKILAFISPPAAQRLIDAVIGGSGFVRAMIENAVVVDESKISTDTVGFGSRVTLVDQDDPDEEEEVYTIVGTSESDPMNGKLSNESPVGAALIGAHVGETVTAQTPGGPLRIKVIEITL